MSIWWSVLVGFVWSICQPLAPKDVILVPNDIWTMELAFPPNFWSNIMISLIFVRFQVEPYWLWEIFVPRPTSWACQPPCHQHYIPLEFPPGTSLAHAMLMVIPMHMALACCTVESHIAGTSLVHPGYTRVQQNFHSICT